MPFSIKILSIKPINNIRHFLYVFLYKEQTCDCKVTSFFDIFTLTVILFVIILEYFYNFLCLRKFERMAKIEVTNW